MKCYEVPMATLNTLSSVVVPTDFSAGANLALTRALWLPLSAKAKITILHVLPSDIPGRLRKEALKEATAQLERLLAEIEPLAKSRGLNSRQLVGDVVEGEAAAQILKRAHTVEADVICMGRHGRNSILELKIGSTAVKVVKQGDVPVLLVRSEAQHAYDSALVALDLTFASRKILSAAKPYLSPLKRLHVLHASSIPFEDYVVMSGPAALTFRDEALKNAEKELQALLKKSNLSAQVKVRSGDARVLILDEAHADSPQLIVLGTHGRKGLKRIILGSVAEWVMTHATCDVLVARTP